MKAINSILEFLGSVALLMIVAAGVRFGIELRNMHAFNKALDKGIEPSTEGIYVVPFSKKKDLLVVPPLWAYNQQTMYHRFKSGEMMTLVTLSGLHTPSVKAPKKLKKAFYDALESGVKPNENGVYTLPYCGDDAFFTLVVLPVRTQISGEMKTQYLSTEPSEYYFWLKPENDKLMALITDSGEVIRF